MLRCSAAPLCKREASGTIKQMSFNSVLSLTSFFSLVQNDSPEPWTIGFQDGASPGFTGIVELHDNIFFYLVVIAILVFKKTYTILWKCLINNNKLDTIIAHCWNYL